MPVHPHLADLAVLGLTKNCPPRIDLFPRPAAAERAPELRPEPRSRDVDLARRKVRLGLMERNIFPVLANRRDATIGLAERRLEKHRVVGEHGGDRVDVAPLPPFSKGIDQPAIVAVHGRKYTLRMRSVVFLLAALTAACGPAPAKGYTALFLSRSTAARLGPISWAPDAAHSRLVAFDGDLRVVKTISDPRISSPVAVARYPGDRLLITERTGEGVIFDTAGKPVREWESPFPFPAALYATSDRLIVAARSPFFVQFVAENGSAPLLWELDTLGRSVHGIGITHIPEIRYLAQLVNAGAVAVAGDRVYFAPLVRDEILRLDAAGSTVWRSSRGMIATERDPQFVTGNERRVAHALINIAMTLGPDGRLYVLGGADSAATTLRLDVLNAETGEILETRQLGTPVTAIAVNRRGQIRVLDPTALLAQTPTLGREAFAP